MADSIPTAPIPPPLPAPATPPADLKPGWKTSEAWISFVTLIIGVIPSSGLTTNAPLLTQIVGMVISALAALHYTGQRVSLKRAALLGTGAAASAGKSASGVSVALLLLAIGVAGSTQISCAGALNCQDPKNAQSTSCRVVGDIVDCTGVSSVATGVEVVEPIVAKLIESAKQPDGSIKWSLIEPQLVDLGLQYGTCVIAEIFEGRMHGGAGPTMLARSTAVQNDIAQEFDRIRARVAPGRKVKVAGALL
jgi:hypothetical protein